MMCVSRFVCAQCVTGYNALDGEPCTGNKYRQTSDISRTLVGNKIVDHPDVVGASPVGAALTTSSFSI